MNIIGIMTRFCASIMANVNGCLLSVSGLICAVMLAAPVQAQEAAPSTGTDPRDFAPKFMPYMRTTELGNGLIENQMTAFGLIALNPRLALTYEIPMGYERDVTDTTLRDPMTGVCAGFLPGGGSVLPNGQIAEGDWPVALGCGLHLATQNTHRVARWLRPGPTPDRVRAVRARPEPPIRAAPATAPGPR